MKKFKTITINHNNTDKLIELLDRGWKVENSCSVGAYQSSFTQYKPFIMYVLSKDKD